MDIAGDSAPAVGVGTAMCLTTRGGGGDFLARDMRVLGSSAALLPHGEAEADEEVCGGVGVRGFRV